MQTRTTILVATLVFPLLLISCSRDDQQSPLSSGTSEKNQAMTPADPGKTLESSPPAAGIAPAPSMPEPAPLATEPAKPPSEPAKSGY